jgi:glycosyltransferase involved in cell wall biosynthesis
LKIGVVVNSAPPFPVAGAERQALEMARRLALHHEVTVFARRFGGAPVVETTDGYRLVRCPFIDFGPLRFLSQRRSFLGLFARHGRELDVVLSYQTFITGYLAALARDRFHVPFVLWIRSQDEYQYDTRKKFRWAARFVLPRAEALLVQSDRMRQEFLDQVRRAFGAALADRVAGRIHRGGNAVTMISDRPSAGKELLFVGRLIALKDLSTLFRALRRLPDPPPTRIVGDGPMRERWEAEAKGLPVTFTGRVEPRAIEAEYRRARAFVLLSLEEGLPNVILEAFAAGVPVLSTPVASVPEVVHEGKNGFLFPFGDDESLARRLAEIMTDDELHHRLALGALETARAASWERIVPEVEGVLRGAASCSRPGGGL